ncbi:MAG TPA: acylphosphatase [Candidatus Sulfomarinibacteraceae bacterium]|nr:acylphosphatase [Candidatus Sulfomarinibacteraceae bacterium]
MKRLNAKVYGRVQGVFFRDTTRREAHQRDIHGWVRNEPDGSVRVVAEGSQEVLTELERFLHRGPSSARVERVETTWEDATGEFSGFRVRY